MTFKKKKNRATKVHLVFDEDKRREFLTGFRKRKLQRKKRAQEQFENELKEERKRLKAEAKESYKKLVVSHRPIPELAHFLEEEYEDGEATVKVVELNTEEIAKKNNWIGANHPKYEIESEPEAEDESKNDTEDVPGMSLNRKVEIAKKIKKFETEKDIKRELKKQATKNVKKSKVFQRKNQVEKQKQKKQSLKMKKQRIKIREKDSKRKKRK